MTYTIAAMAKLSGLSTRALRHYDKFGLLSPERMQENHYRLYDEEDVDRLQQILFYRELGFPLAEIKRILSAEDYNALSALESHLTALRHRQGQLNTLIKSVEKTIKAKKGEQTMTDQEKFEGFKKQLVKDNERRFGQEAREKYGDEAIDHANQKLLSMSQAQHQAGEALTEELNQTLKAACEQGDPGSALAQKACDLHRQWLMQYWAEYSREAHRGLAQTYVDDPRFTAYYDQIAPGCAPFLRDAIHIYCMGQD